MYYIEFNSTIDNTPCVLCITQSSNRKTGPMLQTWILRADIDPVATSRLSADSSICGDCPLRHSLEGQCYVAIGRAPLEVWKAYKRGSYKDFYAELPNSENRLRGKPLRLGAYGDPAACPEWLIRNLYFRLAPQKWTGYSHQWQKPEYQWLRDFCCASVDSEEQYNEARCLGWRPFRTRQADEPLLPGEFECPAAEEQGKRLTCEQCGACNGNPHHKSRVGSAAIILHGFKAKAGQRNFIPLSTLTKE